MKKIVLLLCLLLPLMSCGRIPYGIIGSYDVDTLGIPEIFTTDFVNLEKIEK